MTSNSDAPKWISESEIRRILTWRDLVPAMADVLEAVATPGAIVQPLRTRLRDDTTDGTVLLMPGLSRPRGALGIKLLSMYPGNRAIGLPTHSAVVVLLRHTTGQILALLDGESITELRTAATSAAATIAIRRAKQQNSCCDIVSVLGAGVQGAAHARVMNYVMKPKQIRIWSRVPTTAANGGSISERCQKLVDALVAEGIPAVACASVAGCVANADVINTCTFATKPILDRKWVKEDAHINSVGAVIRTSQELDPALVLSCAVYADSREAAMAESGDIILSGATVAGEVGEVIKGDLVPPKGKTTIFKSLGLAVEDAVSAKLVYDNIFKDE